MNDPDPIKALQRAANELQLVKPTPTHQLALYLVQSVQRYLEQAKTLSEFKAARDYAQLFATYLQRRRAALRDSNALRAMQIRTDRQLGSLLAQTERGQPGRPPNKSVHEVTNYQQYLAELNISRRTAGIWQRLAEIENHEFESWLTEQQQDGRELTSAAALEYWRKHYGPPPLVPESVEGIPANAPEPPDDDEVNGEYGLSNYGSSMQQLLDECAQAFEHILSLTAEPEIVGVCRNYRQKIIDLFAEMT